MLSSSPNAERGASAVLALLLPLLAMTLFAAWPITRTVGLRYSLLIVLFLYSLRGRATLQLARPVWHLLALLLVLTAWLTYGAYHSPYPAYAKAELFRQWYKAVLIFLLGALLANRIHGSRAQHWLPLAILLGICFAPFATLVTDELPALLRPGTFDYSGNLVHTLNNKTNISYGINMALALLATELIYRLSEKKRLLPLPPGVLLALLLGLLASSIGVGARNGMLGMVMLTLSTTLLILIDLRHKVSLPRLLACVLTLATALALYVGYTYKADVRWRSLGETVSIALDTEHYKAWTVPTFDFPGKFPLPKLHDGTPVVDSNYQRIAWLKEGLLLVKDYPWGLGFGRDVFGWGLHVKYGLGSASPDKADVPHGVPINGHSSLIEFTIGAGIPGALLLLAFFAYVVLYGFNAYYRRRDPYGLIVAFLTTGFLGRMMVDSNLRDHTLQQQMFLIGLYLVLSLTFSRQR